MNFLYLIWNGSPEIIKIGIFSLRWYGLLFALGFLISQQLLYYIHRKEGKPEKDVETLTIYMVIATILGARLGHVIFYQPEMLWQSPLEVLLPIEFEPKFRITGYLGLASHGGAIGILFALWLYSRKNKPGQSYLQVLDRIVILVALTGAMIRTGNFFNSEILGRPTDSSLGIAFVSRVTEVFMQDSDKMLDDIVIKKNETMPDGADGRKPILIYLFFKPGLFSGSAHNYVNTNAQWYLGKMPDFIDRSGAAYLDYQLIEDKEGHQVAVIKTYAIARHPAQLYEAISCFLLFLLLFGIWMRYKENLPPGLIFGWFMVILWSLRFGYEYLKENQVDFETKLPLNMGQILSIPLVLVGVVILWRVYVKKEVKP